MFLGHFAVGFGAKKAAPGVSLGILFLASQLVDLLWPLFLLLGLEHVRIDPGNTAMTPLDFYDYPLTHSLMGAAGWSVLLGVLYFAARRRTKDALVVGGVAFSHWVLDLITHRPDLPLAPGSTVYFGFGLWNSSAGTVLIELALFCGGVVLYLRTTTARDRIGLYGFWCLAGLLMLVHMANIFGPPPPTPGAVAVAGNATWLFVIWAFWLDRHRAIRT